jgi:hypothetical protein
MPLFPAYFAIRQINDGISWRWNRWKIFTVRNTVK